MRKRAVAIVIVGMLILPACSENEQLLLPDHELSGEIIIALDYPLNSIRGPKIEPYIPGERKAYLPIHSKVQEFTELHPKVTVKIIDTTWAIYADGRTVLDFSPDFSGVIPDIVELTPHQVRWSPREDLQGLSFYIENKSIGTDWSGEYTHLMQLASVDIQNYLLPVRSDPMLVYYAEPIFEVLDFDRPSEQWAWDDFFNTARNLKNNGYFTGMLKEIDDLEHIINALGGSYLDVDATTFEGSLNSGENVAAFEDYFENYDDVIEHYVPFSRAGANKRPDRWAALGMIRASRMYNLLDASEKGYQLASPPHSADGEASNTTFITGLAMTNAAKDKDLAWELMRYIIGDNSEEAMQLVAANTLLVQHRNYTPERLASYDELLRLIREETTRSQPSSVYLWPTYVKGPVDLVNIRDDSWYVQKEPTIHQYLSKITFFLEQMREEMIERRLFSNY